MVAIQVQEQRGSNILSLSKIDLGIIESGFSSDIVRLKLSSTSGSIYFSPGEDEEFFNRVVDLWPSLPVSGLSGSSFTEYGDNLGGLWIYDGVTLTRVTRTNGVEGHAIDIAGDEIYLLLASPVSGVDQDVEFDFSINIQTVLVP